MGLIFKVNKHWAQAAEQVAFFIMNRYNEKSDFSTLQKDRNERCEKNETFVGYG